MKLSTSKVDTCHLCVPMIVTGLCKHIHRRPGWCQEHWTRSFENMKYPYLEWEQKVISKERLRVGKVFWTEKFSLMLSILFEIFTWAWVAATLNSKVPWVLASFWFPQNLYLLLNFWLFLFFFVAIYFVYWALHILLYIYMSYTLLVIYYSTTYLYILKG